MKTIYRIYLLPLLFLNACDLINPSEEIPAYIYITSFQLNTANNQGTNSNKITDVWLTVNGNFLGAYTLPALIPILEMGEQEITLEAGIKDNGIAATPEIYPFYQPYKVKVDLQPNEVDTLRPVISYRPETKFAFIERFEDNGQIFRDLRSGSDINRIQIISEGAFEGKSGLIQLDKDNPLVELATVSDYENLTDKGILVYLEVNYKSEATVIFGVQGYKNGVAGDPVFDPGFLPSAGWNKIYFNMSSLVASSNYDTYKILLQAILPNNNGVFTQNNANVWLDNIKLVHF
ncbi:MAG: hypothetical protein IPJ74_01375 [Saprospiraceae bacterium]|nr:hypothetical protein [Saprospiraceae bacterium]